ncbi:8-amino-7-oxononanoate synthase [Aneurinibacillus thermoaerophilus]|uniref:8-amino-7-oxononanoate synthase n=1 Tax=Aneurinibacillus thermoaerophilus TaxID=143495 RepID=UPI002E232342|nr:8-amino-7-oxononanoate synthase [Aneurinibacillus thermoaerophilus]MED0679868.1 8-amino-7-oxononanoate synthase [Aneurinibacillus thermoaerophilus]MED0737892.1 8-amino-7-oxononanoate synthase [Aneurinibacillus thermoaerophilus]MED0763732.1 8-amino-7-oxononanoate synthase [Aneurinibacillus thermoaerophilus]
MMDGFERSLLDSLSAKKEKGLLRTLHPIDWKQEKSVFSSNNYLGLARDERLKKAAIQAIETYGTGSGGARLTTGNFLLHERLEASLASFKQKESAIVFSSGYLANLGVISALMGPGDVIFSDELNHASIIDGCRLSKARIVVYRHADMDDLRNKIRSAQETKKLIVTDGVFSMDGDIAPLHDIVEVAQTHGAWVMVDDAHATGVLGETGAGTAEYFGISDRIQLLMGTLSKSVGAEGGYVAASRTVVDYLRNHARSFIFQTSLSPGVVASALEGIRIIREEPERRRRLLKNARLLRDGLTKLGFTLVEGITPIVAVMIGEAEKAVRFSARLEEEGVFAPAIRPPTVPQGSSRIRVTLMATHTQSEIDQVLTCFEKVGKAMRII